MGFLPISVTLRTKYSLGIFPKRQVHSAAHQAEATEQMEDASL